MGGPLSVLQLLVLQVGKGMWKCVPEGRWSLQKWKVAWAVRQWNLFIKLCCASCVMNEHSLSLNYSCCPVNNVYISVVGFNYEIKCSWFKYHYLVWWSIYQMRIAICYGNRSNICGWTFKFKGARLLLNLKLPSIIFFKSVKRIHWMLFLWSRILITKHLLRSVLQSCTVFSKSVKCQ